MYGTFNFFMLWHAARPCKSPALVLLACLQLSACVSQPALQTVDQAISSTIVAPARILVSVKDQQLLLLRNEEIVREFDVSTSMHGLSNRENSGGTPVGRLFISEKLGAGQPNGMVFVDRVPTGELVEDLALGRYPITTRILWLDGREHRTRGAKDRYIYIHGSPAVQSLGTPASGGCIRMRATDVVWLFDQVTEGIDVYVHPGDKLEAMTTLKAIDEKLKNTVAAASSGDLGAIRSICLGSYLGTNDFPTDHSVAAKWCKIGVDRLDAASTSAYAEMLESGTGVRRDIVAAREFNIHAAMMGNSNAMFNLYRMYEEGIGGEQSSQKAKPLLNAAARLGHPKAKAAIAELEKRETLSK